MDEELEQTHFASLDVFERWTWLYAFCRERIFSDHTSTITRVITERCFETSEPLLWELGCGPGFYSIKLAGIFPHWRVIGVDRSCRLIERARQRAAAQQNKNRSFLLADVTRQMDHGVADFVLASRLLLILTERDRALEVIYEALKPGGVLFIAEPLAGSRTAGG